MPILQSQGVKMATGTPLYVPANIVVIDVSNNVSFPESVTVGKDLTVDESANVGIDLVVGGNISADGNITTETGYINQGDVTIGTNYINVDNLGNPNIQIDAKEGGDGQAYLDLITQKLTTSTNLHRVRSVVGNTGVYTLFHETGAPGPLTTLQEMAWSADGTTQTFAISGTDIMDITSTGVRAKAVVSLSGQNPNIAANASTTIFSIPATSLPQGKAAQAVINLFFFDGGLTQSNFVTYVVNICRDGAATINGYAENQATADAALLAQTGQAWTLAIAGAAPQLDVIINTLALPTPTGGWYCNYNYTILGGQ